MDSLIAANIKSRPTRTIISVLAVGVGVILMLIIGGIATGTLNDYIGRTLGVGADFILQAPGSSVFYAFSGAALPEGLGARISQVEGIGAVAPVLSKFSSSDFGLVFGIDLASFNRFPGRLRIVEGRESLRGYEVIVDELYARTHKLKAGSEITILNHMFTVSGICRSGSVVRVFIPLETLQELNGTPDRVTILFVKAAPGTSVDDVFRRIRETYSGYTLLRSDDPALLLADTRMPGFEEFRYTVVLVSMLLSFMVILLAMYTTIFERTREIGILKSLGASRSFILGMILKESVMISCLGVIFGIGASALIRKMIISTFPTLQVAMSWTEVLTGCALGLIGGALGSLYPAYKAARMDPVKALTYE
jgi:putative ABC transport system permease protein